MKFMIWLRSAAALLAAFGSINSAVAWDDSGHKVIAIVAYYSLTAKEQNQLDHILYSGEPDFRPSENRPELGLAKASTFLDKIKGNKNTSYESLILELNDRFYPVAQRKPRNNEGTRLKAWHYKNKVIHRRAHADEVLHHPVNAVLGIEFGRKFFRESSSPRDQAFAIYIISHLVGDLAQPLHCVSSIRESPRGDAGGNGFTLKIKGGRNLHQLWDSGISHAMRDWDGDLTVKAKRLMTVYPRANLGAAVAISDPNRWVDEGAILAEKYVYEGIKRDVTTEPPAYQRKRHETCLRQAALAGYRLARDLRELLK